MIKAIVTDIEGTTSSLSFVQDVLFPYARQQLPGFIRFHADNNEVKTQLAEVCNIVGRPLDHNELIQQLVQWIDEDKKFTPLKALQGMIWESGYKSGHFTGHVYEDAALKLRDWYEQNIKLYVFSSGSVKAQQLIFTYSDFGDMSSLFSGYFDTRIGAKRDIKAYQHIVSELVCSAEQILFLSDVVQELQAASDAGMQTVQLIRDNQSVWSGTRQAQRFSDIEF